MTTDYIKKVLNYCIERQEKIKIDYINNYGRKSTRTIQPIGIREERDLVSCHDSISGEERTFKITKIKIIELPKALKDMQNLSNSSEEVVEENNTSPDFEENVNIINTMDDLNKTFNKDDSINHAHVEKVIDELRRQLLDLTKKNNLINHNHSARSTRFIRVIDELPNILYTTIKDKKMYFKPLPGIEEEPEDEKSNDFKMKYEAMKLEGEEYLKEISRLEEKNDKKENVEELEKIERKLKDKVRKELGLPEIKRGGSLNLANHAKSHKFNPNYDLPIPNQEEHDELHADNKIQTLLLPENLKSLVNKIYSQHNNFKQNMGVNLLRVSYGYLEWYESESSDVACHAPLLMMPVELIREKNIGSMRYALTSQQEEAEVNSALIEKLKEFQIKLPEFEEEDDPESYFIKVTKAVEKKARWKVRRYVTIGIYSFNKVAQFHDLNPENWQEGHFLTGHDAIATLLYGKGVGESVGGVLDESYDVDEKLIKKELPPLILDADASQHSAIIDALDDNNLVIQGPPGTGKSQTIANLIGASIYRGKSVLFVAEKTTALEVVANRLRSVGLGSLILELHINKRNNVIDSIKERIEDAPTVNFDERNKHTEDDVIDILKDFTNFKKILKKPTNVEDLNNHDVIWRYLSLRQKLNLNEDLFDFKVKNYPSSEREINEIEETLQELYDEKYFDNKNKIENVSSDYSKINIGTSKLAINKFKKECDIALKPVDKLLDLHKKINDISKNLDFETNLSASLENLKSFYETILNLKPVNTEIFSKVKKELLSNETVKKLERLEFAVKQIKVLKIKTQELEKDNVDIEKVKAYKNPIELSSSAEILFNTNFLTSTFSKKVKDARELFNSINLNKAWNGSIKDEAIILEKCSKHVRDRKELLNIEALKEFLLDEYKEENTNVKFIEDICSHLKIIIDNDFYLRKLTSTQNNFKLAILGKNFKEVQTKLVDLASKSLKIYKEVSEKYEAFLEQYIEENKSDIQSKTINEIKIEMESYKNFNTDNLGSFRKIESILEGEMKSKIKAFLDYISEKNIKFENKEHLTNYYKYLLFQNLVENFESKNSKFLQKFDGANLTRKREKFRKLDKNIKNVEVQKILEKALNVNPPRGIDYGPKKNFTELALIKQQIQPNTRKIPTRDLVKRAHGALKALKPVWMISPKVLPQFLGKHRELFDILIIDEASQLPIEEALGSIVRSKKLVVVGDDQQLPPTDFFQAFSKEDTDYENEVDRGSILDLAGERLANKRTLRWHYRSRHESLIEFSNHYFYKNKLLVFPSPNDNEEDFGFKNITIKGNYISKINELEARTVTNEAKKLMIKYPEDSLGIICMNKHQKELVQEMFDKLSETDEEVKNYIDNWHGNNLEKFIIQNLEDVQGNERDNIIISTVFGKQDGIRNVRQNFGPIGGIFGHRRLNVLFTRARSRMYLITSLDPSDIKAEQAKNKGPNALRGFIEYSINRRIESGEVDEEKTYDSDFEEMVANSLDKNGYKTVPQVGVSGFRIDLGVKHDDYKYGFLAGIECDGAMYHSSMSARDRDRIRQDILEDMGWKIYRVWSTDWFSDPDTQTKKMIEWLDRARNEYDKKYMTASLQDTKPDLGKEVSQEKIDTPIEIESTKEDNMFERPHGRKREYTLEDEIIEYYETDPGKYQIWKDGKIIGKIIKDTGSILGDIYNPNQASFDLPNYHTELIKGNSTNTKKTDDIYKSLEWIWRNYNSS